jgi:DNA-binding CsgD family transcriptional regulator
MPKVKLTEEDLRLLVDMAKEGKRDSEIAKKLGISVYKVQDYRLRFGVKRRNWAVDEFKLKQLIDMAKMGVPDYKIAEKLGVSIPTVYKYRLEYGIRRKPKRVQIKLVNGVIIQQTKKMEFLKNLMIEKFIDEKKLAKKMYGDKTGKETLIKLKCIYKDLVSDGFPIYKLEIPTHSKSKIRIYYIK